MRGSLVRMLMLSSLAVTGLAGCEGAGPLGKLSFDGTATGSDTTITGSVAAAAPAEAPSATGRLTGDHPTDPVAVGKRHFREGHFGLAEEAFRKAVEMSPRDAEAWVGLAASYDRLRRFDLADRAYRQAIRLVGQTAVILNNQGYSFMLRGDLKRARAKLAAALAKDPGNATIAANLAALDESLKLGKDVR